MTVVGLQWVQSTDTYSCPAADSIGSLTPATRIAACNSIDPWMSMVRCNLWDTGVQTASYGARCYTDTDVANMGQAMVKIKKFWYGTDFTVAGTYKWYISSTGADSLPANVGAWKVHPAFVRNGVTKSQIYLGAYEGYYDGVSKLESVSGVTPTATQTIATFRTQAEARGTGWEICDYLTNCALQLLYLVEYGTFYAYSALGHGICSDSAAHNTGETAAHGNASYGSIANQTTAMSYRGVENWYGNLDTILDGINFQADYKVWVADHSFATNWMAFGAPYVNTALVTVTAGDTYGADITTNATYDYGFIIGATAGAAISTDICSRWTVAAGNRVFVVGSQYNSGSAGGAAFSGFPALYDSVTGPSARLMYIG